MRSASESGRFLVFSRPDYTTLKMNHLTCNSFVMSKEFYNYLREDTQGVMSGPATAEQAAHERLVSRTLRELFSNLEEEV